MLVVVLLKNSLIEFTRAQILRTHLLATNSSANESNLLAYSSIRGFDISFSLSLAASRRFNFSRNSGRAENAISNFSSFARSASSQMCIGRSL